LTDVENLAPTGFDPQTLQPVMNHCTDYAIPAPIMIEYLNAFIRQKFFPGLLVIIKFKPENFTLSLSPTENSTECLSITVINKAKQTLCLCHRTVPKKNPAVSSFIRGDLKD
jgi:hypothetical protein